MRIDDYGYSDIGGRHTKGETTHMYRGDVDANEERYTQDVEASSGTSSSGAGVADVNVGRHDDEVWMDHDEVRLEG